MMKVAELMEILAAMPKDAAVVVQDADTGWLLHVQFVQQGVLDNVPFVRVRSDYDEEFARQ